MANILKRTDAGNALLNILLEVVCYIVLDVVHGKWETSLHSTWERRVSVGSLPYIRRQTYTCLLVINVL